MYEITDIANVKEYSFNPSVLLSNDLIRTIKSATVAIGLVDKGNLFPKTIIGSGFLFDPKGYVMTAGHVATYCKKLADLYEKRGQAVEFAVFHAIITDKINFAVNVIEKFTMLDLVKLPKDYAGPTDLDIACGKPIVKRSGFPFLKIKSTCEYTMFDDLFMCGYPRGDHSLSLEAKKQTGMRFSPTLQHGRIAGMLPSDEDKTPYAIQTDIIGTGGSSGSPIVNKEGEVLAIAQRVIASSVYDSSEKMIGEGNIGITYGATSCVFTNFVKEVTKYYDGLIEDVNVAVPLTAITLPEFTKA